MSITKSNHLDISQISFSTPYFFDKTKTACLINILYKNKPLYLQTPKLLCKFGLSGYKDENCEIIKSYTIALQFNSSADKPNRVDNFQKKLKAFDNLIFNNVLNNTKQWLNYNKKIPKEALKTFFNKSLLYKILPTTEIDYSTPPTFKTKLPFKNNHFNDLTVLNTDNKPISFDLDYLEQNVIEGAIIKTIVQPTIWIRDKKIGITYNLKSILIYPNAIKKKIKNKSSNSKSISTYFNNNDAHKSSSNNSNEDNNKNSNSDSDSDSDNDNQDEFDNNDLENMIH